MQKLQYRRACKKTYLYLTVPQLVVDLADHLAQEYTVIFEEDFVYSDSLKLVTSNTSSC